jgi:hypothetical protein
MTNAKTKLSHLRRPDDLTPDAWQRQLRRQFGREQKLKVENLGDEPVFCEYRVTNPKSGGSYRVAIRGAQPGENFCACPDFAANDLGTCKHIEFVLARLERRPGGMRALRRGLRSRYSEIYLRYGGERQVRFRAGSSCPQALARRARLLFRAGSGDVLPSGEYLQLDEFLQYARKSGAKPDTGEAVRVRPLDRESISETHQGQRGCLAQKSECTGAIHTCSPE